MKRFGFGKRLREPSTWAALCAPFFAFGMVSEAETQAIMTTAGSVAALLGVFMGEAPKPRQ